MNSAVKHLLRKCGLDVKFVRNVNANEIRTLDDAWRAFLQHRDIRTVIDVGANTGQFAQLIHRACPDARILSFEPLPDCRKELTATLAKIPGSKIFPVALGDTAGTVQMNRSEFSPCSSLLNGTNRLGEDYPDAARVQPINVPLERLDDVLCEEHLAADVLLKLDVQGYELPVIRGGLQILKRAAIVVIEVCFFRKLYDGQPLFDEIYRVLRDQGFIYMGSPGQYPRKSDGRIVEADAVFERDPAESIRQI